MISGQVDMSFPNIPSALPQVNAGTLRALGVTTAKRSNASPQVPTMSEAGVPGYDMATWYGLIGPANMAPSIRTRLNAELQVILANPQFKVKLLSQGAETMPGTALQFENFIKSETERWRKIIEQAKISIDQ